MLPTDRRPLEGEWQEAVGRRRPRRRTPEEWDDQRKKQITKFFISNLPENCSKKEIEEVFGGFGEVVNIYIARKRNAAGEVFGFISFVNVYGGLALQRKMGSLSMGGVKIKCNIARFAVENFDYRFAPKKMEVKEKPLSGKPGTERKETGGEKVAFGGWSYKDKLINAKVVERDMMSCKEKVTEVKAEVSAFKDFHDKAVVGRATDFESLCNVKNLIQEGMWEGFEVVYLGGMYVLVLFEEEGMALSFLKTEGWKEWFQEVELWKGQTIPFEKLVWLNVVGIPLHLAVKEVYDLVGNKFGKVVHHFDPQLADGDLSTGCIGVLRDNGIAISEEVKLSWKNSLFSIWVKESGGTWIPDCIGRVEKSRKEDEGGFEDSSESMAESSHDSIEGYLSEKEVLLEKEENLSTLHGKGKKGEGLKETLKDGVGFHFNGINYGKIFPSKKRFKSKVKIIKKGGMKRNILNQNKSSNSVSPRPKKRARNADVFGLDEIIEQVMKGGNGVYSQSDKVVDFEASAELNKTVIPESPLEVHDDHIVGCDGRGIEDEISKTVDVGGKIGISLVGFEKEVEEAIMEEGMDGVAL